MQTGTAAFGYFYTQTLSRVFRSLRKKTLELSNSVVRNVNHRFEKYGFGLSKSKAMESAIAFARLRGVSALIFFAIGNLEFTIG